MHSPFRSESDVFRAAIAMSLGLGTAVAIGALVEPAAGGVLAAALIGLMIGLTLHAGRGSLPVSTRLAEREHGHGILVIANQTVAAPELMAEITNRASGHEHVELMVISPSVPRTRLETLASDTDKARSEAEARLQHSLETLRSAGFEASGTIGDEDPLQATRDALATFGASELIISTLPDDRSRWLERGVVDQVKREIDLPVAHVVVESAPAAAFA